MNIQAAIRSLLVAHEEISDLVGDQVRPDKLSEKDSLAIRPAIILELGTFSDLADLSGTSSNEADGTVLIICCAHTRAEAGEVEATVKSVQDGYRSGSSGLSLEACKYQSTSYEHEPPDEDSDSKDWYLNVATYYVFARA